MINWVHLKCANSKVNKSIELLCKLQVILLISSFIGPHLDYKDIIFDQVCNKLVIDNLEWIQYNASLAITGAIRGTSRKKFD